MEPTGKAVILLVDDKPANIFVLEQLLDKSDRKLLKASDGKEALKMALNTEVDLIILDVNMPDMDGFEVAQILKSNNKTKDIPIIFASAEKTEHTSMMKGFEEGAVDYLFKPLDPEITKAKVSVLLKIQLQKKELIEKNLSLEKAALLISNSADIIGIIDADSLVVEEINDAFTNILGYPLDKVKGKSLTTFLDHENTDLLKSLKGNRHERFSFETSVTDKSASLKWLQWNVVVKYGKWFVNARDITAVKEAERIRYYISTVVKQSNDAIYIYNDEGEIISWNEGAENIYGYNEQQALKMKVWDLLPEGLYDEMYEINKGIMAGKKIETIESKRLTSDKRVIDVLFSASLMDDFNDGKKSVAITERDITQQKEATEQIKNLNTDLKKNITELETTNKELESFSYSVSHDLRAPLRIVNGYCQIFEEDYTNILDESAKQLLKNIKVNVVKMDALINDMLRLSRSGRKDPMKTKVDMDELVKKTVAEITGFTKNKAEIKINQLQPTLADYSLISQVWVNLISNAIKYSGKKEKPVIEIGSYTQGPDIVYFVKDNGAGFNMNYANKLFNPFQRLHNHNEFEGTGIGLAIIHRIIAKHGGKVWAEGKVDNGATFYFTLPGME